MGGQTLLRFVVVCFLHFAHAGYSLTLIFSDFDDTIVETRKAYQGTFNTPFKLFRIERLGTTIIPDRDEPKVVEVSPADLHRIKKDLGQGEGKPNSINLKVTLDNGQVIHPGYYHLRNPESFEYFLESPSGTNYLLDNFKAAEKSEPLGKWKGPFWNSMVNILNDEKLAKSFAIISARAHSDREWLEFFEYLREQGYIKFLPNVALFKSVSRKEFEKYDVDWNVPNLKVNILEEVVSHFRYYPLTEEDNYLNADGDKTIQTHQIFFIDDKKETVEKAIRLFQSLNSRKLAPIKFAVYNMGTRQEIEATQRPQYSVIKSTGTFRHATDQEKFITELNCSGFIHRESLATGE